MKNTIKTIALTAITSAIVTELMLKKSKDLLEFVTDKAAFNHSEIARIYMKLDKLPISNK